MQLKQNMLLKKNYNNTQTTSGKPKSNQLQQELTETIVACNTIFAKSIDELAFNLQNDKNTATKKKTAG